MAHQHRDRRRGATTLDVVVAHGYNLSVPTGEHQNGHLPQHSTETQAAANYPYLRRGIVFPYPESAVCATTYVSLFPSLDISAEP